jgi:hypothetical protein
MREFQRPTPTNREQASNVQHPIPKWFGAVRWRAPNGYRCNVPRLAIAPNLRRFNAVTLLTFLTAVVSTTAFAVGGVDATPSPAPAHEISFTHPKETKLDNGLRVVVAERPSLPLLAMELIIRSGSEKDPNDRAGTASLTGSLLTKGTEKMTAPEIANAIESLGGTVFSSGVSDYSSAGVLVMSSKAEPALTILSVVVLHPAFKQEEIDRLRKQSLDGLRVALQQPGSLASYVLGRVVYGDGEYGHASGDPTLGHREFLPELLSAR